MRMGEHTSDDGVLCEMPKPTFRENKEAVR